MDLFAEKTKPLGEVLRSFGTKKNALVDGISGFVPIFQRSLRRHANYPLRTPPDSDAIHWRSDNCENPVVVMGCTVPVACNYDPDANANDGSYDFLSCQGCTDISRLQLRRDQHHRRRFMSSTHAARCSVAPLWQLQLRSCATTNDGSCDFFSCIVFGCNNPAACNFDPLATFNDGSCDLVSCIPAGCTLEDACNYDPEAELNDGTCDSLLVRGAPTSVPQL